MAGETRQARSIALVAVYSRFVVLGLLLISRLLASPYDTSALIDPPCLASSFAQGVGELPARGTLGRKLGEAVEGTIVWDAVYYVRIAECGYEYEQSHAFLPMLPVTMRFVSTYVLFWAIPLIGRRATLALSGYLISNLSFVCAAIYFYRLSCYLLRDTKLAATATYLFCFNPASVFYFSIYSESMFALFSFAGLWCLLLGAKWRATLLFGLSSAVRSNGVLNAGFLLFQAMHEAFSYIFYLKNPVMTGRVIVILVLQVFGAILPFLCFQGYGYLHLCWNANNNEHGGRPWCNSSVPYLYGFVQKHYWNVGFLNYFHWKQLPNFLLAAPMLILATCAVFSYAKHRPLLFFSIGFAIQSGSWREVALLSVVDHRRSGLYCHEAKEDSVNRFKSFSIKPVVRMLFKQRHHPKQVASKVQTVNVSCLESNMDTSISGGFHSPSTLSFLLKLTFMTLVASLVMHVQVATRFLSSSLPIYWYAASIMGPSAHGKRMKATIWTVFICYITVGTLLFANFYPFT